MANTKSAEKRNRQNIQQRIRNRAHRSRLRTAIKSLRSALASGDAAQAQQLLPGTLSVIDKIAQKGVIHANAASRYKARLTKRVAEIGKA
ncbi:MAG TPA: 30S ribosomal protein S20 [Thermoanaerobaculia bacterium]|jgi:small subunit ribosomal protein S20|nr:30S ribosomal protein S20 [Thermoanaerobaculia bacterium]